MKAIFIILSLIPLVIGTLLVAVGIVLAMPFMMLTEKSVNFSLE